MIRAVLVVALLMGGCEFRAKVESKQDEAVVVGEGYQYRAAIPTTRTVSDLLNGEVACTFVRFTEDGVPFVRLNQRLFQCDGRISRITKRGDTLTVVIIGIDNPSSEYFTSSGHTKVPDGAKEVLVAEVRP